MKRYLPVILLSVMTFLTVNAQNFYHSPEGKTYLDVSTEQIVIGFKTNLSLADQASILSKFENIQQLEENSILPAPSVTLAKLQNVATEAEVYNLLSQLENHPAVQYAGHFLVHKDGTQHGVMNKILVRLNSPADQQLLFNEAKVLEATVISQNEFDRLLFHVEVNGASSLNPLEVANQLHETGLFAYAEPDFLRIMFRFNTNDTYVDDQWSLENDGVNTSSWGGTIGADMKVFDAWSTTTGSGSIKVAVIDEGVDLTHPDLVANMLTGYDATNQGSGGAPQNDDAHGTACAGIIAGVGNNNLGVAGVAYGCKIIPVRIAYGQGTSWVTSNSWIGNGMNWAWQTANADILSNSWGGGGSSSTINNAIDGAVNNGRGGLGSPVLFAAGNDDGANSYPATYSPTISVIAMSMCNERKNPSSCDGETWWGSNYGSGADLAAPGVKIYATDISGSAGYSTGDYVSNFNGTSSATPNAAGVMALLLSANNGLTEDQARVALESTCDKVGGYSYNNGVSGQPNGTWSNDLGYGRINADAAVASVAPTQPDDAGVSAISAPSGNLCVTVAAPQVTLRNNGSNSLFSATINYQVDAGAVSTYNWNGNLASGSATNVTLPVISFSGGNHTFNAYTSNPNGQTDSNPANDGSNSSFYSGPNGVTLTIILDNYPEETSWEIRDGGSILIASGGTYGSEPDGSTVVENVCLADGCYDFTILDAYGDGICCGYGSGSYILTEDNGGGTLASGGSFGSSETTNFCVQSASPLSASVSSSTDVSCNGGNDGSATAAGSGGVQPYSYAWSNGANTATASGLTAGSYTVTVTDNNSDQATANVTITEPSALSASSSSTNASCNGGNDGTASASGSGGTAPYSYSWNNGGNTANISGLAAGSYTVTITDANGCQANSSTSVSEPSALSASAGATNVTCNGGSDGTAGASASGGTGPYSYNWSNGGNTANISGLSAGNYGVTITDANGCEATAATSVTQPSVVSASASSTDVSCNGGTDGSTSASASGGVPPYSYSWSNGGNTANISGLSAGSYTVTVTDASGCQGTASTSVTQPSALSASASSSNVSCNGANDGSASASASGGTAPYSYAWSNGGNTASINGLGGGSYSVTVTDANGCQASASTSVSEPSTLSASASSQNASCNGGNDGSVDLTVSGGTSPYSYNWSHGANTEDLTGVGAGSYSATVTDANGCVANANAIVTEPSAMSLSASATDASCAAATDGSVDLTVSGGTGPYSYSWSNGANTEDLAAVSSGTYTVTVTDANGCNASTSANVGALSTLAASTSSTNVSCNGGNDGSAGVSASGGVPPYSYSWSNGGNTASISSLAAGGYSVTVTDAAGCQVTGATSVSEPSALSASASSTNVYCNGANDGSASASASGGTAPYSYAWSNGGNTSSINGLGGGSYSVTVTDANGCQTSSSTSISEPSALSASASSQDVSCNGGSDGSVDLTISGGTAPYSYNWNNGANTEDLSGVGAGSYSATVTDANGCVANANATVTEPSAISLGTSSTEASCAAATDGSVDLSVSGGTAPYSFNWSNGANTEDLTGVSSGTYSVTVTDANGCNSNTSSNVGALSTLAASATSTNVGCNGGNDGSAGVSASGGIPPYTYNWSNGGNTANISSLAAGSYNVTVTDAAGCQVTAGTSVSEPSALSASAFSTNVSCNGASDGTASASAAGGTAPYSYAWSNGGNTANISGLGGGSYSVTVTDANGCQASASTSVSESTVLGTSVSSSNAACNGGSGSVDLTVSGGTAPFSYNWSNGANSEDLASVAAGTYNVTVTDANGCVSTNGATVSEPSAVSASASSTDASCNGGSDGTASASASGGTAPYTYNWSNGGNASNISGLSAGSYSVTVTDANGCDASASTNVGQPSAVSVSTSSTDETCAGNDGTATASGSGGTAPYSYSWSNGGNTATINGLAAGSYGVTVTDANGCATSSSAAVNLDCGGCNYATIDFNDFEGGWGIWNDGGSDCSRSSNSNYAYSGSYSIQLRDNTSTSVATTDAMDLTSYDELTVLFSFIAVSMDNNSEDFWLQVSTNGSTYTTVEEWNRDDEFVNNQRINDAVVIAGPFTSTTTLRFRCDASGNSDWVYIDDVQIDGCFGNGNPPTCTDGVQNGNETGVDCGGPDCPACPTCTDGILNGNETDVDCGGPDCPACPTCSDGIQNGDETGVDCGGSSCPPCGGGGCTYVTFDNNDFEGGWGIWNDGGSDCRRSSNDAGWANSGNYCVRLRDNTSTSVMTTDVLDFSGYDEFTVNFSYIANSMENVEDFWFQVSSNGGSSYTTVEEWNNGDEFTNGSRQNDMVTVSGPFTNNMRLRFRCDASGNSDWVYIDDVLISVCSSTGSLAGKLSTPDQLEDSKREAAKPFGNVKLFPNPADQLVNIEFTASAEKEIEMVITDISGQVVEFQQLVAEEGQNQIRLETNSLKSGYYFVNLVSEGHTTVQKVVVTH